MSRVFDRRVSNGPQLFLRAALALGIVDVNEAV